MYDRILRKRYLRKCYTPEIHHIEKLRDYPICRSTNSNWKIGPIWICTGDTEFLDGVDLGGVAFAVESLRCTAVEPVRCSACSSYTWLIYDTTHSHVSFICVTWLIHVCDIVVQAHQSRVYAVWTLGTHHSSMCVASICVTWLVHTWGMTHSYVCHDSFIRVPWLIHTMWTLVIHGSFIHKAWLIHVCDMTHSYVWQPFVLIRRAPTIHDSPETWLILLCDLTRSYVWHDPSIHVTWPNHTFDLTHPYMWQHSFMYLPWLIHVCAMTHSCMCHDSFIHMTWLIHICEMNHPWHDSFMYVTCLIHDMAHSCVCQSLL